MDLKVETQDLKQSALIVSKKRYPFIDVLKKTLGKFSTTVYLSPKAPKKISQFDYCFFINEAKPPPVEDFRKVKKAVFIYIKESKKAASLTNLSLNNVKVIDINNDTISEDIIDKILWFVFSKAKEPFLKLYVPLSQNKITKKSINQVVDIRRIFSGKTLIAILIALIIIFHTFFIIPLSLTSYFSYQAYLTLKKEQVDQTKKNLFWQTTFLGITKKSYQLCRPTWLLFTISVLPDNLIEINQAANRVFNRTLASYQNSTEIIKLIFNKNKTTQQKEDLLFRLKTLKEDISQVEQDLNLVSGKIPSNFSFSEKAKKQVVSLLSTISQFEKILPYLDEIFAKDTEKKYLLLFANNMELRPGGGFIGSYGILSIKDYTIEEIKIYDVYDADGQLVAHVEPPKAIRNYLNQPHWFLRDSAFSPDFFENYTQAKFFLDKELGPQNFDGGILITTSAIENILESFGNIYLPDFKENVNKKNFYLKTQYYSENNFFPGSIQKKSFLSSLTRQILLNLESTSKTQLISGLKKSLDEKQIVFSFEGQGLQKEIDSLYWSGKLIEPSCVQKFDNCIVDFLYPIDANLGVNKANFFVSRYFNLKTKISDQGEIKHTLTATFKNDSPAEAFPGGSYKNYFQIYLPKNISIKGITKDGVLMEPEDITIEDQADRYKVIGLFFEVKPKASVFIKIDYQMDSSLEKGRGLYQLIVQKQVGSANNDLILDLQLGKNIYILSQNFSPLVKDNQIIYNTNLTADKIFFVELIKDAAQ